MLPGGVLFAIRGAVAEGIKLAVYEGCSNKGVGWQCIIEFVNDGGEGYSILDIAAMIKIVRVTLLTPKVVGWWERFV
jgi:hypothetical protein